MKKTAQEKAKELVNKCGLIIGKLNRSNQVIYELDKAKKLALLIAEENLESFIDFSIQEHGVNHVDYGQSYWCDVIKHIERM